MCYYLLKFRRRCVAPKSLAKEHELFQILNVEFSSASALTITEFLTRVKLRVKLDQVGKIPAERDVKGKNGKKTTPAALVIKYKEHFGRSAPSYVVRLFNATQCLFGVNSDIAKGKISFDLNTLLCDPIDHAFSCFVKIFSSFSLDQRGYFTLDQEPECAYDYWLIMDDLRRSFPDMTQPNLLIPDAVQLLLGQCSLRDRPLIFKMFRLSCLCLDEPFTELPSVKFESVNTDDPASHMTEVITPVLSYITHVAHGVDAPTTDDSVAKIP